jgi:RNA polymerase sigma factor (sigma-70 family)
MEDVAIRPQDAAIQPDPVVTEPQPGVVVQRSAEQAEQLVLDLITAHADSLLRTARRYSLCADDAQDAYQRGLEILMRHAARLDADRASGWLHTVVKHEALAINRTRSRSVGGEEVDFDAIEVRTAPSPEDRVLGFEQVARSAEALQRLKPQEVRALWLKAMGNSYQEICDATGWSYTKVNRCLAEGRKSFLARYAGIEGGDECRRWAPVLSAMVDGEASAEQLLQLRPHLRNCAGCRAALRELRGSNAPLAALFPVGGVALLDGDAREHLGVAGDLLSRLWHSLWGDLSDRVATAAFRVQSAAEAFVPGKSMAVLASAAALAGGGVAIDEVSQGGARPHAALPASSAVAADKPTRATIATSPAPKTTPASTASVSTSARAKPKAKRRAKVRRHRRRTVRVQRAATAGASASTSTTASTPAPTTAAPARPAPVPAPAPLPAPTPRPAAPSSGGGSSGEFSLESH